MKKFITKLLGAYIRSGVRGSTRLTDFLTRLGYMNTAPVETNGGVVFGDMRLETYRGLLAYKGDETDEQIAIKKFVSAGDTAFDVGVHWGLYTAFLSKTVGPSGEVHAFEPNSNLHRCLQMTANKLGNATLHRVALSDRDGEVDFFVPSGDASMASLSNWTGDIGWQVSKIKCQLQRLDDLISAGRAPRPKFIKCDVEGAEMSVFQGARATLDRADAPTIMFEINPKAAQAFGLEGDSAFRFLETLSNPRYRFFEVLDGSIRPVNGYSGLHLNQWNFTNAIAVPASRSVVI